MRRYHGKLLHELIQRRDFVRLAISLARLVLATVSKQIGAIPLHH